MVAVWLLLIGPSFAIDMVAGDQSDSVLELFQSVLVVSGTTLGALLPFVVLSFANGFYRERLKGLLHLGNVAQPPRIAPPMPAVPEVAGG
jgi:hypothetical protein